MSRFIEVQVTDEVATRMASELAAANLHEYAACIDVLVRDRQRLRDAVPANIVTDPRDES